MENDDGWKTDNACYEAGRCPCSVEDSLSAIEEQYLAGEITEAETIQLLTDLHNSGRKPKMRTATNLLDQLFNPKSPKTEMEQKLLYKAAINALTSATASNILMHLARLRRPEFTSISDAMIDKPELGGIPSLNGEPTLDQRNAEDHESDGSEFHQQQTEDAGHEIEMAPYRIAEICDGIRNTLYERFEGIVDLQPPQALYRNPKINYTDRINYDQPMSLEFNLQYRIRMSGTVNETRVKQLAIQENKDENFIRAILREDSERLARQLAASAPEVIREAEGFDTTFDEDAFQGLPLDTQVRIATKIASDVDREYRRLYGIKLRTGGLELANDCAVLESCWAEVRTWITGAEKLLTQMQNTR